ncbi:GT2 family glycosyltransferase [Propionicimonas paludicola]|uniref:GT2 family glycosyltransferase n=1 Tax=Propionicimonas paludicola TaxID=185243 RepID=A0A2A9CVC8_9ACTN|nr:GT2 family glycosyltransferase [Propionicimonas paludicola]
MRGLAPRARLAALSSVGRSAEGNQLLIELLISSGLFDLDFYRAQQPDAPADLRGAANHFLTKGILDLATFHPAILPGYLEPRILGAWLRGDLAEVFRLLTVPGLWHPWSPGFFPPAHVPEASMEGGKAGKRALILADVLQLLAGLGPDSRLRPDPTLGFLTETAWPELRDRAIRTATAHRRQLEHNQPRSAKKWNADRERRWIAATEQLELPASSGEPLVSIIMPAWNRESVIATAVDSIQAQTMHSWELLIIDDGSSDSTATVAEALAAADPRIRLLRGAHAGVCAARNLGLAEARGRYIAFLDTDNTWRPRFLELSVKAMAAQGLEFAYCGSRLTDSETGVRYRGTQVSHETLLMFNHIDLNVTVVGTELLRSVGGFDPSLRRWVDHDLAIRLSAITEPHYLPFIGCDYDDSDDGLPRITTVEGDHWEFVVLGKAWCDWAQAERELPNRVSGRVSIVMPVFNDARMTLNSVDSILANSGDHDIEVVVVDNGSRPDISLALAVALDAVPRVRVERLPRNLNFAIGSNVGAIRSTGELILFLNNDTLVRPGWLDGLLRRIADPDVLGVQPLLLYPDLTIQSAGTLFPGSSEIPAAFLSGFPKDDGRTVGEHRFSAVTAAALLMRAGDVVALRGFDSSFINGMEDIDLCLRAGEGNDRYFAVEPSSEVIHLESRTPGRGARIAENRSLFVQRWRGRLPHDEALYQDHGFEIVHVGVDQFVNPAPRLVLRRFEQSYQHPELGDVPVLRWGIRNPATADSRGDQWGDTHFVAHLAKGLRQNGQQAVETRFCSPVPDSLAYDDVSVVIRGLRRVDPMPGKINVLWVISHPELVTVDELAGFDLVFAASVPWAAKMSTLSGRPVLPLLQATDPERFHPAASQQPHRDAVLFVGQARSGGVPRQIVMDAVAAGVPLEVWGPNWTDLVDPVHLKGDYLNYTELPVRYRQASRVLNDHWSDMAAEGFISNRVFDVVAAGGRVITDEVAGMVDIFGGAVQSYRSVEELKLLCSAAGDARYPDDSELVQIAARVGREHSFTTRAKAMLEEVLKLAR